MPLYIPFSSIRSLSPLLPTIALSETLALPLSSLRSPPTPPFDRSLRNPRSLLLTLSSRSVFGSIGLAVRRLPPLDPGFLVSLRQTFSGFHFKNQTSFWVVPRSPKPLRSAHERQRSSEPEPIDWEYYRKGIGSRLVDMYKEAYDSNSQGNRSQVGSCT